MGFTLKRYLLVSAFCLRQLSCGLVCFLLSAFYFLLFRVSVKRLFDIVCSALGLLLLLPLSLLIALAIKLAEGGPVFYGQIRVGQFGKPFRIWKFRSMVKEADKLGLPLTPEADCRITPLGSFLRRFKLDELPQLWNVLVGEMSFVGPRPEVPRYVEQYTAEQRDILRYKPGITDIASMLFRNEQALLQGCSDVEDFYLRYCLPKKIELNRQYATRANLAQDLWIILQTLCPYWLGVLAAYTGALVFSLGAAYVLRFDFRVMGPPGREFLGFIPWVVCPQLLLLVWRGQLRGLLSYVGPAELRQTGLALTLALVLHLGLLGLSGGRLAPRLSILLLDFILSCAALGGLRLGARLLREHFTEHSTASQPRGRKRCLAIIGAGETGIRVAWDYVANERSDGCVVAFFDDDPRAWNKHPYGIPVVGMPECLLNKEWRDQIDEVIIALPPEASARARKLAAMLEEAPLKVSFTSGACEVDYQKPVGTRSPASLASGDPGRGGTRPYPRIAKAPPED
jgi:lipopolysaccharide/colanic/teichoic acid biosynthesis glycosyltransferase